MDLQRGAWVCCANKSTSGCLSVSEKPEHLNMMPSLYLDVDILSEQHGCVIAVINK